MEVPSQGTSAVRLIADSGPPKPGRALPRRERSLGRLHDVQDDLPQIRVIEGQLDVGGKPALLGSAVEPAALIDDPTILNLTFPERLSLHLEASISR